jgi:hypothetical protein
LPEREEPWHHPVVLDALRGCFSVLAALAVVLSSAPAEAYGENGESAQAVDCSAAGAGARRARDEGKLLRARQELTACAEQCSGPTGDACRADAAEVLAATPTLLFEAQDAEGHDLHDVTVALDGVPILQELDGKAIAVDPGPHSITFAHHGILVNRNVGAVAGAKAVAVDATFYTTADGEGLARDTAGHTVWPWAVVAGGAAVIVAGIAVVLTAPSLPAGCDKDSRTCTASPTETAQSLEQRRTQAGESIDQPRIGGVTIAVGALVVGGALAWHFLESPSPRTTGLRSLSPWIGTSGTSGGGLAASGVF